MKKLTILEDWVRKLGSEKSGNYGHAGRPGKRGGSVPKQSAKSLFDEVKDFVGKLTLSGGYVGDIGISDEARELLRETVTKKEYHVYRGIGLVRGRVSPENMSDIRSKNAGDPTPDYLAKSGNEFASYTHKKGVAKYYSEGKVSVIIDATVPKDKVVVDTRNLQTVLARHGKQDLFDSDDYDYFKSEAEVIVQEPISSTILSIK